MIASTGAQVTGRPDRRPSGILRNYSETSRSNWRRSHRAGETAAAARDLVIRKLVQPEWLVLARADGDHDQITASMVADAASAGDCHARSILERAHGAFAFALTQAIALLAPRRVVIGGGVSLIANYTGLIRFDGSLIAMFSRRSVGDMTSFRPSCAKRWWSTGPSPSPMTDSSGRCRIDWIPLRLMNLLRFRNDPEFSADILDKLRHTHTLLSRCY